ncbi:MAG: PLP-dependent aminotransferase family protein [Verrucomicrobia bacterium]|nr:PLP-dependent aminotransferase family protein [Verrucomicrobiota bacterium]
MKTALSQLGQNTAPPSISWLMQLALSRPKMVSLAAGFTDNESLPVSEVREVLAEILATDATGQAALQYGTTPGDPQLRKLTAAHLLSLDADAIKNYKVPANGTKAVAPNKKSPSYAPESVLITNGSQQLLYMITEALFDPGDIVILEDPTYFVYLNIAQSRGLKCRGVKLLEDGIDLQHLEDILEDLKVKGELPRLKMLYLVTYFQNPSSVTTSYEKKCAALKLLKKYEKLAGHPIYLLEDAAYRELRFSGAEVPTALTAPVNAERVIFAGTYSKPFSTGVRVGFGVLPEPLLTVVTRIKGNHDFGSANILQQILKHSMSSCRYKGHLQNLRQRYQRKAEVMLKALQKHFPKEVTWIEPEGGLYFWVKAPSYIATGPKSRLFKTAIENDVLYVPGELCYADDSSRRKSTNEMRLSFGGASLKNIELGIARLGKVLHSQLKK